MNDLTTVEVDLGGRSYRILIGERLIEGAGGFVREVVRSPRAVLIADRNLERTGHLERLEQALRRAGLEPLRHLVEPGEASKSLATFGELMESILAHGIERSTPVIAFGGGVVGDLAGFCGATLLRGLDVVQIPTTLLAQVDSAVGGKTGINSRHGKNLIGSFHQPRLVLCDVAALETLPPRELRAGYAEVVKYGLIDRPEFFEWLEAHGADLLAGAQALRRHAVAQSCRAKAEIVAQDEREGGRRALLNLGHTFAHALERLTGYGDRLLHGEAVAVGIVLAFALSVRLGFCPKADLERVRRHFRRVGLPDARHAIPGATLASDAMIEAMRLDKKAERGQPRFVLTGGIGKAFGGAEVGSAELGALLDADDP